MSWKNLLIILFCFAGPALWGQSMDKLKIKENYKRKKLSLVILDLEINYRLKFEWDRSTYGDLLITCEIPNMGINEAMQIILQGTRLGHSLKEPRTVVIEKQVELPSFASGEPEKFDFTLKGVIKDQLSGESLPFAEVIILNSTNGTTSNVDGYFTLFNVPSDTVLLEVRYLGYQTRYVRLSPGMDFEKMDIELKEALEELQEILVVAEKEEQLIKASTGISKVGLTPATIATLPSIGERDIFRSLQLLPGISGTNEGSSGLYVRGGTPDQNLVLLDGFTVYHVDHLFGFFSAFNSQAIKDVQLYKGGFEPKFGGRLSSVVELTGKDGNTEEFNVGGGISLVSANAFVESPFADGKGSFLIAGRRSFQSNFYNNLFDKFTDDNSEDPPNNDRPGGGGGRFGQFEVEPNSYFYDLNAKVTYRPSDKDIISLSFYNGQDNLDNSRIFDQDNVNLPVFANQNFTFRNDIIDLTNWGNWGSSLKWSRRWSDRFYTKANASYSNYFSERDQSRYSVIERDTQTIERRSGTFENNDLRDYTLKIDNEWKLSQNNQLGFGAQITHNDIDYSFVQNDTITLLDRQDTGTQYAFYLQDQITIADKLILKGGLRATYFDVSEQVYMEPRASFIYQPSTNLKFKGAWGKYYQFANRVIREDIQQGSRDFWLLANDNEIPVSAATHYILGASYENNSFLFDVEAYYKDLSGLSEYTTRFALSGFGPERSLSFEETFFVGDGIAKGIEFLLQKKVGKYAGWLGYTLGSVRYNFEEFGEEDFPALHDQTHEFKLVNSYKLGRWTFAGTFIFATGKPYTAPVGYYQIDLPDGSVSEYWSLSDKNALRLPNYHRLDLSASVDLNMGGSKANAGLSVFNVYGRNNVWYKEYEVIEGELLETDVTLLNFTPSLFFNWTLH